MYSGHGGSTEIKPAESAEFPAGARYVLLAALAATVISGAAILNGCVCWVPAISTRLACNDELCAFSQPADRSRRNAAGTIGPK
jgi:hypothetical protein